MKLSFREHPELYRVRRGEQGVLLVEPYKSELLPYWRFRTPKEARKSVRALLKIFRQYESVDDFVGMDMIRKYDGPVPRNRSGQSGADTNATVVKITSKLSGAVVIDFRQPP